MNLFVPSGEEVKVAMSLLDAIPITLSELSTRAYQLFRILESRALGPTHHI